MGPKIALKARKSASIFRIYFWASHLLRRHTGRNQCDCRQGKWLAPKQIGKIEVDFLTGENRASKTALAVAVPFSFFKRSTADLSGTMRPA